MTDRARKVLEDAKALSPEERADLAAELLATSILRLICFACLPLVLPGCLFFGFGCDIAGSALQSQNPEMNLCAVFDGDCCTSADANGGFSDCGDFFGNITFPCGRVHNACGCVKPKARSIGETPLPPRFVSYTVPPFTFGLGMPFAGFASVHRLAFDVVPDRYQTFQGAITYSPGFGFSGFTALGPANTTIGSYGMDVNGDDVADFALPLRAASADLAYADIDGNGQQTPIDPTIQHLADSPAPGAHTFTLVLPAGGDRTPGFTRSFLAFRAVVVLSAGILDNPATPGSYGVQGTFTSVDPDTGGASNGTGSSPTTVVVPPVAITVDPSPLALLDHFLCYKSKPSKGNICSEAASGNRGALCISDAECGGVAGACVKNKLAKGIQAGLGDRFTQFVSRTADVKKPLRLCAPAEQNGDERHDTITHLRGYQIGVAKDAAKPVLTSNLAISNSLGTIAIDINAPDTLYVPVAKALGAPAPTLGVHTVDHYQCYKAKLKTKRCAGNPTRTCKSSLECGADGPCLGKFPKGLRVALADQFTGGAKLFDVKKPTRLCAPAMQDGSPIQSPGGHLMCYQAKAAAGAGKHAPIVGTIHTNGVVGRDRLDTVVEDELCVPSLAS